MIVEEEHWDIPLHSFTLTKEDGLVEVIELLENRIQKKMRPKR